MTDGTTGTTSTAVLDALPATSRLIRLPQLIQLTTLSESALGQRIKDGLFPPAINLGGRAVAYILIEVEAVIQALVEGKTTVQIKALVAKLITQRKTA